MRIELNITNDNWQEAAQTVRETLSHLHLGPPAPNPNPNHPETAPTPAVEAFSSSTYSPDSTPSSSPSTNAARGHASSIHPAALGNGNYAGMGENFYPADPKANIAAKPWIMPDAAPIMFISASQPCPDQPTQDCLAQPPY